MGKFQKGNTVGKGRPQGSRNFKNVLPQELTDIALKQLQIKVEGGDSQAIMFVLNRVYPALKAITPQESLEGELLSYKLNELDRIDEYISDFDALFKK
ncbi:hypothetical protein AB4160_12200 [Shewanella sp. 10N.286.51.B8]|uniref:hypothetical protein n=1 Tax=Shewanella sp. 10N.286.51.B8 TaxID=3229708 RepID=UPI00354E07B0